MAAAATSGDDGGMDIRIHPLVVMSVADHYTRSSLQFNRDRVMGVLFGRQEGRVVDVYDVIEIPFTDLEAKDGEKKKKEEGADGGGEKAEAAATAAGGTQERAGPLKLEMKAFEEELKLFKEAYPNYEVLGWYSTGAGVNERTDSHVHRLMSQYNENPLYLVMDPNVSEDARELPLSVYEEVQHVVNEKSRSEFVKVAFQITSDEAERVTAVHCAKVVVGDVEGSALAPHFGGAEKAVRALRSRVEMLHTFLQDVEAGKIRPDHATLRSVRGVCNRLPTMDSPSFNQDLVNEYNDALMVAYLASITKGASAMLTVADRVNVTYKGRGGGGGGGGGGGYGGGRRRQNKRGNRM